MPVVLANSALDVPLPSRRGYASQRVWRGARLLGMAAQGFLFFAVLWLLVAGPGFLSARDSTVPAATGRPAPQASR